MFAAALMSSWFRPDGSHCSATRTCVAGSRWSKRRTTRPRGSTFWRLLFSGRRPLADYREWRIVERAPALAPAPVQAAWIVFSTSKECVRTGAFPQWWHSCTAINPPTRPFVAGTGCRTRDWHALEPAARATAVDWLPSTMSAMGGKLPLTSWAWWLALAKAGQALAQDRDRRPCLGKRCKRLPALLHSGALVRAGAAAESGRQRGFQLHA